MQEKEIDKEDEISLKELVLKFKNWYFYLLSKWVIILIAGTLGGILGFAYAYFQKPIYTAETTFVLEEGDSGGGGLGAYAGLASMAGIDLGGGGGGIFQGDNILQLYKSRRMIQETLLSADTFNNKSQLLIDRYIAFNNLREAWGKKQKLANISFQGNPSSFTRLQDSIVTQVVNDINKNYLVVAKLDKKLSIISVKVNAKDEFFAKAFANSIVKTVNDFYVNTKTKKSAENLAILQFQADSIKRVLNYSISGVASAIDANPNSNPAFQTLRVPSQKKQLVVQVNAKAYEEIIKNLEIAKITFRKEKPLIQVIDEPVLPLNKDAIGKLKGLILGSFLFTLILLVALIIKRIYYSIIKND